MHIATLFTVANVWKQPRYMSADGWTEKMWGVCMCVCVCMQWNISFNKEAPTICKKMDGPGGHYTKLNKPDTEVQTRYHLTCMWNLK